LSDRPTRGQKTLVFEDAIDDYGRGERITRRFTIAASDKYGLPTALDGEIILALIELTHEQKFASRKVDFTRYHLREVLGWRDEGRSYHRIDMSLRRWMGVTLYYDKAWWDNASGIWVDEQFHILERVTLRRRETPGMAPGDGRVLSSFTWNEVVFRSFEAGYLKKFDWEKYRELQLPTAKRMYRFLDKRFWHKGKWEFDLAEFAFEHIGLSRAYDAGQLKRKLMPAVRELEGIRFLRPAPAEDRFKRVARGSWRIIIQQARPESSDEAETPSSNIASLLTDRGVSDHVARALVKATDENVIRRQVEAFDRRIRVGDRRAIRNPGGFLVSAIKNNYRWKQDAPVPPAQAQQGRVATSGPVAATRQPDDVELYLQGLSAEERAAIEIIAVKEAQGLPRRGLDDATKNGHATLVRLYREAILLAYVRDRLLPSVAGQRGMP
jgi:hypothetical protein